MAEQTTPPNAPTGSRSTALIKADQIEGLREVIRTEVKEALREEVRSAPEDMDQLRRSPAGTMIRLEEQVKAFRSEMDQRFGALEEKMDQRFNAVDQRFDALKSEVNQRFDAVERRFNLLQWAVGLIYPILLTLLGKLFLMK